MIFDILKYLIFGNSGMPLHFILGVTEKCNSKCQTCYNWKNLNAGKKDLTLEEMEQISLSLKRLLWLAITGGEPFLRSDLDEICAIFYKNNFPDSITIPTNGLLPDIIKEKVESILSTCKDSTIVINLSLDGLEKTHDEIRGVSGNFNKVMETYAHLVNLKKDYSNLSIKVATVINNKNYNEIVEFSDFVYNEMSDIEAHSFIFLRGEPKNEELSLPKLSEMKTLVDFIKGNNKKYLLRKRQSKLERKLIISLQDYMLDLYLLILKEKKQIIPCYAGNINGGIDASGNVFFCELMPPFGNIRDNGTFKEIWTSNQANELRKSIKEKSCFCTHGCVQPNNVIFNPKLYFQFLKKLLL